MQVRVSHFPYVKTANDYDYNFQPGVNKDEIKDLCSLPFIEQKENILFYGTPGTGKAHEENRLEHRLRHFCKHKLLIIDEIGYLPVDKTGANLFLAHIKAL